MVSDLRREHIRTVRYPEMCRPIFNKFQTKTISVQRDRDQLTNKLAIMSKQYAKAEKQLVQGNYKKGFILFCLFVVLNSEIE